MNRYDRLLVVRNREEYALAWILYSLDVCKCVLDLVLYLIHIYITYDNDSLKVRTIPLLVVVTKCLVREVHNDVHSTDRHTVSVLTSRVNLLEGFFLHTHHGTTTHTPFLIDDTTLLVNLLVFEEKVVAPVVKDEETRVNGS